MNKSNLLSIPQTIMTSRKKHIFCMHMTLSANIKLIFFFLQKQLNNIQHDFIYLFLKKKKRNRSEWFGVWPLPDDVDFHFERRTSDLSESFPKTNQTIAWGIGTAWNLKLSVWPYHHASILLLSWPSGVTAGVDGGVFKRIANAL